MTNNCMRHFNQCCCVTNFNKVLFDHFTDGAALENMRLKELFKKTEGTKFHINWLDISMDALQDRHSIKECMA